jgi:hypothetical protein
VLVDQAVLVEVAVAVHHKYRQAQVMEWLAQPTRAVVVVGLDLMVLDLPLMAVMVDQEL